MNTVIIILINLAALLVTAVTADINIIDSSRTGFNKLTGKGKIFLILGVVLIVAPLGQDYLNGKKEEKKSVADKVAQDFRDSLLRVSYDSSIFRMKTSFDESQNQTVGIITEKLGKYKLGYDSLNKRIVSLIKDSSKTTILNGPDPVLTLVNTDQFKCFEIKERNNGVINISITITSLDASSTGFNIIFSYVGLDSLNALKYLFKENPMPYAIRLGSNTTHGTYLREPDIFRLYYLWVRGTYKNSNNKKTIPVDEVYFFNPTTSSNGNVRGETMKRVVEFINKNEKHL